MCGNAYGVNEFTTFRPPWYPTAQSAYQSNAYYFYISYIFFLSFFLFLLATRDPNIFYLLLCICELWTKGTTEMPMRVKEFSMRKRMSWKKKKNKRAKHKFRDRIITICFVDVVVVAIVSPCKWRSWICFFFSSPRYILHIHSSMSMYAMYATHNIHTVHTYWFLLISFFFFFCQSSKKKGNFRTRRMLCIYLACYSRHIWWYIIEVKFIFIISYFIIFHHPTRFTRTESTMFHVAVASR